MPVPDQQEPLFQMQVPTAGGGLVSGVAVVLSGPVSGSADLALPIPVRSLWWLNNVPLPKNMFLPDPWYQ